MFRGSNLGGGRDFPHLSTPALGSTQPPVQWVPGLSRVKERPGRDADPSPPSSAVGHERVELYLCSPYGPYGLYRASVPVQGWPLPLPYFTFHVPTPTRHPQAALTWCMPSYIKVFVQPTKCTFFCSLYIYQNMRGTKVKIQVLWHVLTYLQHLQGVFCYTAEVTKSIKILLVSFIL